MLFMFTFDVFVLICLSRHNVANSIAYLLLPMNGGKSVGFTINSSPKSTQPTTTANLKLTLIGFLSIHLSIYLYLFHRNHKALKRTMEQDEQG